MTNLPHQTDVPIRTGRVLHVGRPNFGDRKIFDQLVDGIFERRWFTNGGELVQQLEKLLCNHLGVRHCIPVSSATLGLQLACRALEITNEVILPAFTFIASAHAVCWEGATPVFADIDPQTHSICPESVRSLVTKNTTAIMGVHLWGNPCNVEKLQKIADAHKLKLLFDAAHAFHCKHNGKMVGNFGDCEVFSFHATKFFNTFEGGAIATNNDQLAEKIRLLKNFGFAGRDRVIHLGINAKMSEVAAAMGISMFGCISDISEKNRANYQAYHARLAKLPGFELFSLDHVETTNWQYVVAEIDEAKFGCSRDEVLESLIANKVLAKRYFFPGCHNLEPYRDQFEKSGRQLVHTDFLCNRVLCLPTGNSLKTNDLAEICEVIVQCYNRSLINKHRATTLPRKAAG